MQYNEAWGWQTKPSNQLKNDVNENCFNNGQLPLQENRRGTDIVSLSFSLCSLLSDKCHCLPCIEDCDPERQLKLSMV